MSSEESDLTPVAKGVDGSAETADDEGFLGTPSSRRTFLKAAALGTAAAAVWQKGPGLRFGPAAAFANDLSNERCTANDVRIVGPGVIINEPCDCTGTFTAEVKFHVINNTGTERYCVTTHFCPGTNGFLPGTNGDVVFGDIPANFDGDVTVSIPNYPCGSGLVCFGETGSQPDGSFLKGEQCAAGKCCTTITWNVKASDPCPDTTRQITSKCRHQQVCIQGRGVVTLDCDTSVTGVQSSCPVPCGATATVRLCTTEAAALGPFTFVLKVPGQTDQTFTGPGPCHDFTVGPITDTIIITGEVTSADGCKKSASTTLTTTPLTASIAVAGTGTCDTGADVKFTASVSGGSGCSFQWSVDGSAVSGATGSSFTYPVNADNVCHTVSVDADCGGCKADASTTVKQCVNTTSPCPAP